MSGTLKDYEDWLKAWTEIVKVSEVQLEQAVLIMPVIEKKIEELKTEVPETV